MVAITLDLFPNGAVGFIDWLDHSRANTIETSSVIQCIEKADKRSPEQAAKNHETIKTEFLVKPNREATANGQQRM